MIIEYTKDLSKQRFLEEGKLLREFGATDVPDGLVLLEEIDEPVAALDRKALSTLPNGQLISHLFNHPNVPNITRYDGVDNSWLRLEGTWPSTIDTITHLVGQRKLIPPVRLNKVLDIACGNGLPGHYALVRDPSVQHLDISDISPNAIKTALANWPNQQPFKHTVGCFTSDGFDKISSKDYNLIIASAIPATPGFPGLQRPLNPLFEGTDLLEKIVRGASNHLAPRGRMLISHTSCGDIEFEEFARKYGVRVTDVLFERETLYRTEFLGDQRWIDWLVERGGLRKEDKRGHSYWHTVRVKEVSYE